MRGESTEKEAVRGDALPYGFPGAQLHEEANHESSEQNQTRGATNLGDEFCQIIQLLL